MNQQEISGETLIDSGRLRLAAPAWHTALVVILFVGLAVSGVMFKGSTGLSAPIPSHGPLYITLITAEIGLVFLVRFGLRRRGTPISEIVGPMDPSISAWARDVAIAAALWAVWIGVAIAVTSLMHSSPQISGLIPHGVTDGVLWVVLSTSAGIAEELAFRGYLLRQFRAMTGNVWVALLLQSALFSIAHGYEGLAGCVSIAVFGFLFGMAVIRTGNLRACMIAHAWADIAAGLL
jgi:membrane protease YdiL (CAAX protease family)